MCFVVPENVRLNPTHDFIIKISSKSELKHIAFNHLSDIKWIIWTSTKSTLTNCFHV